MKYTLISLLVFFCLAAADNPFSYTENTLKRYSYLNFTWWGFNVYKAEVWTKEAVKPKFDKEILLHLIYKRNFKAKDLLKTTLEEWERLKLGKEKQRNIWIFKLSKIWPDVKKGDSLTTYMNGEVTSFYQGKKLLGQVKDKEFGPIFLKIWLHEKSKTSSLLKKK